MFNITAQIEDIIIYKRSKYDVIAVENIIPFNIEELGLNPVSPHTACWRGFHVDFNLTKSKGFVIKNLNVCQEEEYPEINGVKPYDDNLLRHECLVEYENVNIPIKYTGGIIIGKDF